LAKIDFVAGGVASYAQVDLGTHLFQGLSVVPVSDRNLIVLVGSQNDIEGNIAMTQVVSWSTAQPYLTVHNPTSLLPTSMLTVYRNDIRSCYVAPNAHHPFGVLLFTYVDALSGLVMLVRGKIDVYGSYVWVLPSPHVVVSLIPYYNAFTSNRTVGPQLVCPPNNQKAYLLYQSEPPTMNSFIWHGGYRLAGIAENEGGPGTSIQIVRVGTTTVTPYPLQAGFSYYANNSGIIHSTLSVNEQWSPNGWGYRLGTALSESQLLLDFEVIDRINNAFW